MCEILGQSHWCSQDSISRIKILISNPQVPNMKTCPKSLNYRYAGFQISDWNSNFQSPLVWTTEKLLRNPIHKIYCLLLLSIKKTNSNCPIVIFVSLLTLPHYDTILHIAVISIFIKGSHIKKKIISNFILLERPLSIKLLFHYYNQFKSQIKWQREMEVIWMSDVLTIFFLSFCCWFVLGDFFLFFFLFFLFSGALCFLWSSPWKPSL